MDRKDMQKSIPHGYKKIIAEKAGVKQRSVSMFLTGKTNSYKIEMAALSVLAELADNKKVFTERIGL